MASAGALPPQPVQMQMPNYAAPHQQYVVIDSTQHAASRSTGKVKYSNKNIKAVKGLTITQLALGITILIFHSITTALNDEFTSQLSELRKNLSDSYFFWNDFEDYAATGIWVGILIIISASVGIGGYKKQKKALIVTHLILNVFILICLAPLIATVSSSISELNHCRRRGEYLSSYYDDGRTYTRHVSFTLLGEYFSGRYSRFYCNSASFTVWLTFDVIILVCAVVGFFVTLPLLIYNSVAACICCQSAGCCGGCCFSTSDGGRAVAYYAPATGAMMISGAPMGQPQYAPQVAPQLYAQPTPLYTQPMATPVVMPAMYGQQPAVGGSSSTAQPFQSNVNQPTAAAAPTGEKREELPPEYAALYTPQ